MSVLANKETLAKEIINEHVVIQWVLTIPELLLFQRQVA